MAKKSPAKVLKEKGLIPKSWDLRKPLSVGQKSWITKLTQKAKTNSDGTIRPAGIFRDVVQKPAQYKTISAVTRQEAKAYRDGGLQVSNGRAVVRVGKGGRVRKSKKELKITITNNRGRQDIYFANAKTFNSRVAWAAKKKLAKNQVWGFNIGNNINNVQEKDFGRLMRYLETKEWKSPSATEYINLVLITANRRDIVAHNILDDDEEDMEMEMEMEMDDDE